MAIACGSLSNGSFAGAHSRYILATQKYEAKLGVEHTLHGNMPTWAASQPTEFWDAADCLERANGIRYREWQGALPRELDLEGHRRVAEQFAQDILGDRFVYTLAIHHKERKGREANPHVHLMWNDRMLDGVERPRDRHFRRYNGKNPERGGCKKDQSLNVGRGRGCERLVEMRQAWEKCVNRELERAQVLERIDMRSYKEQGIEKIPQLHLGAGGHALELRGIQTLRGDYNRQVELTNRQLEQMAKVKDLEPEKVVRVYEMGVEVAERQAQTVEAKLKASAEAGDVVRKREQVEVLSKELDRCLEMEPTVPGKGFDPIADIQAKLDQAKEEQAIAEVVLEEKQRDPEVLAQAQKEMRRDVREIQAARKGVELLRSHYELAQVEIEIKQLEALEREHNQDKPVEHAQEVRQRHQVAEKGPQPAGWVSSNPDHARISRLPTQEDVREIEAKERERGFKPIRTYGKEEPYVVRERIKKALHHCNAARALKQPEDKAREYDEAEKMFALASADAEGPRVKKDQEQNALECKKLSQDLESIGGYSLSKAIDAPEIAQLERERAKEHQQPEGRHVPVLEHELVPGERQEPEPGSKEQRQRERDEKRIRKAQQLQPREFIRQYTKLRELAAQKIRGVDEIMKASKGHHALAYARDQAEKKVRNATQRLESVARAHPVQARLGFGKIAKLREEQARTQHELRVAQAKLGAHEKDPKVIAKCQAVATKEAQEIETARHEVKVLQPVYEKAEAVIKLEREQEQEKGLSKGRSKGREI